MRVVLPALGRVVRGAPFGSERLWDFMGATALAVPNSTLRPVPLSRGFRTVRTFETLQAAWGVARVMHNSCSD